MPRTTTILPDRKDLLLIALVGSLVVHLLAFATYELGVRLSWWSRSALAFLFKSPALTVPNVKVPTLTHSKDQNAVMPMLFVDVSQSSVEEPKDTKYYSSANSLAANQTVKVDSKIPNIDGKQEKMIRTQDVPREKTFPLQPTTKATPEPKSTAKPEPKAAPKPGDLASAKPANSPTITDDLNKRLGEAAKALERPRTVQEARSRNPNLAGEKMKQTGGVPRPGKIDGLDVRKSPFGDYDGRFIAAVQNRWYDLIDERRFVAGTAGDVMVKFRLNYDGRITEARIVSTTAEIILTHLCQKAIEDPAPFERWPDEMRRIIGGNSRELTFTFHYY